jgi:hypothetical protein
MEQTVSSIVGPGKDGPVSTCRFQMLREGLQEAEARVFVQNALLDQADKLGSDLAKKSKDICDERSRMLRYCSEFHGDFTLTPTVREGLSLKLYQLTDEVAKALKK